MELQKDCYTGNGGINVVAMNGVNANGTITLSGGSNDIFYINIKSNLDMNGVILTNGVTANNVFWNIIGGQNNNLSGTLNGTFLAFNAGGQATPVNISNALVEGDLFVGSLNATNVTENGIALGTTMAPEASSTAAMLAFACFVLVSSASRFWKNKLVARPQRIGSSI